jgi:hypothetical protein
VFLADRQYQLLKARALAAQQEREREMQYEIEAKAARLKAQRKEEEEVCPFSPKYNSRRLIVTETKETGSS